MPRTSVAAERPPSATVEPAWPETWPANVIERRAVAALIPMARNARTHSAAQVAQLAAAIKEWGFTVPVVVDESDGIIAGHGRVLAAQKLKLAEVPVVIARGWSDAKKRAYVIADNKVALNAGWDYDMLGLEISDLRGMGVDLQLMGFDTAELAEFAAAPVPRGPTTPRVPNAVLAYNLVFENPDQQKAWFDFIRYLRTNVVTDDPKATIAALFAAFVTEHGYRG